MSEASVGFLGAGTILALVMLSGGAPVHGGKAGRIVEIVLIAGPIISLVLSLLRGARADRPSESVGILGDVD